ncbi:MAG: hypothetical protein IT193_01940, partial [Propionibacteriaceae bacterium]|nr:hypothetical protein [Propionibacteriaceae bacterium]
ADLGEAADLGDAADLTDAAETGVFWVARERADCAVFAVFAVFADGEVLALSVGPALGVAAGLAAGEAEVVAAGDGVCESAEAMPIPPTTVRPMAPVMAQAAVEREIFMFVPLVGAMATQDRHPVNCQGEPGESSLTALAAGLCRGG